MYTVQDFICVCVSLYTNSLIFTHTLLLHLNPTYSHCIWEKGFAVNMFALNMNQILFSFSCRTIWTKLIKLNCHVNSVGTCFDNDLSFATFLFFSFFWSHTKKNRKMCWWSWGNIDLHFVALLLLPAANAECPPTPPLLLSSFIPIQSWEFRRSLLEFQLEVQFWTSTTASWDMSPLMLVL